MNLLSYKDVCGKTSLSKATILRMQEKGEFPKGRRISGEKNGNVRGFRVVFLESDIDEWIEALFSE